MPNKAGKPTKKRAPPRALAPPESRGVAKVTGALLKPQPADGEEPRATHAPKKVFPIVAVGASAGGLEAFTQLLMYLPANTGMAYVFIQHLDPTHASQLPEILSKRSTMPVREVHRETPIRPNHVYTIAANQNLRMEKGVLQTIPRPARSFAGNKVIDDFMESLAEDCGAQAFGVVLSGTASDGTIGLRAIKAEGGITFAQEPSSAKFDGMPSSAIAAGTVDFVLSPEAIAKQLVALAAHPYVHRDPVKPSPIEISAVDNGDLGPIFSLLRSATGIDFTYYKQNTLRRRIERRMAMQGVNDLKEYSRRVRHDSSEAKALAQEFLINVTTFFREPETYQALRETVFPALIKDRSPDNPTRLWIPGCSTGEEAYSHAISLTEFLEDNGVSLGIQIFATDLSESAIERARAGLYLENAVASVSAERLTRFFTKRDRVYQISQDIRNVCVFAKQDLTKDPPFSKIDLISCCNLLIYLGPVLQKKVISVFHYALKPGGFLLLGSSESAGSYPELFQTIDRKHRIYAKKRTAEPPSLDLPVVGLTAPQSSPEGSVNALKDIQTHVDRMLLSEYAPAGVIIDDRMNVLQVRGDANAYLQFPPGEPTTDLTRLVRPGLLAGLRSAVRKARQHGTTVTESGLRLRDNRTAPNVNLRVSPIHDPRRTEQCFLVLFENASRAAVNTTGRGKAKAGSRAAAKHDKDDEISRLEQELEATRDYLQSIIESQEAATQELRSANEEAQATNEELDTAKEELQASNEELNTVNDELRARNQEQSILNSDLRKLLESINIPLVVVGRDLHIRWFTPAMEPLLNLLPRDRGRPITDLHSGVIPNFRELLVAGLAGKQHTGTEIESPGGRWLSLRILPYRGTDNAIDGAIATLIDIDDPKRARDFAEAIVAIAREPLIVLDGSLRVRTANQAFYDIFQLAKESVDGHPIYEIGNGQWNNPALKQLLEEELPKQGLMKDFEVRLNHSGPGAKNILFHAREIRQGDERLILLAIDDITQLRQSTEDLRKINDDLTQFIYAASHDLQEPIRAIGIYTDKLARKYSDKLGDEGTLFVKYAAEGAQRLEELIAGLREFWELSERVEEQHECVDCNQVLDAVRLNFKEISDQTGAEITGDDLPSVTASEAPLIQLFQNLIGNAIKYRSDKPPRIHVSAARGSSEWIFAIEDNGIGIDPKYFVDIFGVFKRLHSRSKYPGTGIGLAICKRIVERYGGRIWVEGNAAQGSTFKFTIPS